MYKFKDYFYNQWLGFCLVCKQSKDRITDYTLEVNEHFYIRFIHDKKDGSITVKMPWGKKITTEKFESFGQLHKEFLNHLFYDEELNSIGIA